MAFFTRHFLGVDLCLLTTPGYIFKAEKEEELAAEQREDTYVAERMEKAGAPACAEYAYVNTAVEVSEEKY